MNVRSLLTGVVVLGLLAAGIIWSRSRSAPDVTAGEGQTAPAFKPGGTVGKDDDSLPDATLSDASVDVDGIRVTLSLAPQPPVAFARTRVRVRAESAGSVVPLEHGRISFEMTMPMGDHRYSLLPGEGGWQEAEVILPRCMSGKRRWYATVEGTVGGEPRTARFRLDLAPPSTAP